LRVGNEIQVAKGVCQLIGGPVPLAKKALDFCLDG